MTGAILVQLDVLIGLSLVLTIASMVVTLVVQAVAGITALRGVNLRWGVTLLLQQIDASNVLGKEAEKVASAALHHPLISDSIGSTWKWIGKTGIDRIPWPRAWRLAKAVRPEELAVVLRRLALPPADGELDPPWRKQLVELIERRDAAALLGEAIEAAGGGPLPPALAQAIARRVNPLLIQASTGLADVRLWFDSTMDRVSQRFATHTRIITVAAAFVLAFAMQLDVLALYARISADSALRATLVAQAQAEVARGGPGVLEAEQVARAVESAAQSEATKTLLADEKKKAAAGAPVFADAQAARDWVARQATQDPDLQERFEVALVRERASEVRNKVTSLADLCLIPWPLDDSHSCPPTDRVRHAPGIFVSALLLCLGAPFWFNLLKAMVSLRPVVAQKTESESKPRSRS
jgi:hypothetical protein